jgi:hypothetical protein
MQRILPYRDRKSACWAPVAAPQARPRLTGCDNSACVGACGVGRWRPRLEPSPGLPQIAAGGSWVHSPTHPRTAQSGLARPDRVLCTQPARSGGLGSACGEPCALPRRDPRGLRRRVTRRSGPYAGPGLPFASRGPGNAKERFLAANPPCCLIADHQKLCRVIRGRNHECRMLSTLRAAVYLARSLQRTSCGLSHCVSSGCSSRVLVPVIREGQPPSPIPVQGRALRAAAHCAQAQPRRDYFFIKSPTLACLPSISKLGSSNFV